MYANTLEVLVLYVSEEPAVPLHVHCATSVRITFWLLPLIKYSSASMNSFVTAVQCWPCSSELSPGKIQPNSGLVGVFLNNWQLQLLSVEVLYSVNLAVCPHLESRHSFASLSKVDFYHIVLLSVFKSPNWPLLSWFPDQNFTRIYCLSDVCYIQRLPNLFLNSLKHEIYLNNI
jgi:hypothetical protein